MQLLHGGAGLEDHCSVGEDDALVLGAGLRVLLAVVDAPTVKRSADSHSVLTTEPFFQKAEPKQKQHFRWCALRYSRYHDHKKFSRTEYRNTIMQPQKLR